MRELENWLNGVPFAGTIGASFLTGAIYGREFDISWETLAAGFLGLIGGFLAFLAATREQQANRERNTFALKSQALTPTKDAIQHIIAADRAENANAFYYEFQRALKSIKELEEVLIKIGPLDRTAAYIVTDLGDEINWIKSAARQAKTTVEVTDGGQTYVSEVANEQLLRGSLNDMKQSLCMLEAFCDPAWFL